MYPVGTFLEDFEHQKWIYLSQSLSINKTIKFSLQQIHYCNIVYFFKLNFNDVFYMGKVPN